VVDDYWVERIGDPGGVGCKSLPGNLEIDTPFFDIEYTGEVKD